ncbi:hypothetical protein P7C70_g7973, partial [Phenoliferia sp. Uapishka_3]
MATFDSLPPEIISKVFSLIKTAAPPLPIFDEDHQGDRVPVLLNLVAFSLISSTYRHPAQRALFQDIYVTSFWRDVQYTALRSASEELRECTRSLVVNHNWIHSKRWLDWAMLFPNLRTLVVLGETEGPMRVGWSELDNPHFSGTPRLKLPKVIRTAYLCHSIGLRELTIRCPEELVDPADPASTLSFPFALTHLSLDLGFKPRSHGRSTSPSFLCALFTSSQNSLVSLRLRVPDKEAESALIPSFHLVASNLSEIHLESENLVFKSHLHILGSLTALTTLMLSGDYNSDQWIKEEKMSGHIKAILDALPTPPTLKTLRITHAYHLDFYRFLLDHTSLANVKSLALPNLAWRIDENLPLLPKFGSIYESRGVKFISGRNGEV